jgi:hypothetical protein
MYPTQVTPSMLAYGAALSCRSQTPSHFTDAEPRLNAANGQWNYWEVSRTPGALGRKRETLGTRTEDRCPVNLS